jgi:predicted MPP superfamily phosphohydrolase
MSLFLLTFFAIYGGVHCYFFMKAQAAFPLGPPATAVLVLFLVAMTAAPVGVRMLESHGHEATARFLAYAGYLWMGFLFLFFCVSLAGDAWRLGVVLSGRLAGRNLAALLLSPRAAFLIPAATGVVLAVYAYGEALAIRTDRVTIVTPKLSPQTGRIRICQLSDVHLGLIVREERLRRMLAAVREADPDLLVITGDLLDGQADGYAVLTALFREMRPRLGTFAVTGNHEFYVGIDQMERFCREAGMTLLRGEGVAVGGVLTVAGVDDPAGLRSGLGRRVVEKEILDRFPRERFTILLKHRPVVDREAAGRFDLQLSGHVHGGQIFPFWYVTRLFYPAPMGLSAAGDGSSLYVSRGTGTWGPPLRLLAPPEVTVIDLVPPTASPQGSR